MTDFEKAQIKKEKKRQKEQKHKKRFQIHFKDYEFNVFLFPIAIFLILFNEIKNYSYNKQKWNTETAKIVLDKALPHIVNYDKIKKEYYCEKNWVTAWRIKKHLPFKYRSWFKKYNYKLKQYLIEEYYNDDYEKIVERDYDDIYIIFKEKT